jgi:hypothetical protein
MFKLSSSLMKFGLLLVAACLLTGGVIPATAAVQDKGKEVARYNPNDVLRAAQTIFIKSKSVYFKATTLENSLLQRDEFQEWGMSITRTESDADLIIEVGRKLFTTSFVYSVIDTKTNRVIASGRVNSIGGTVEGKITDSFMKKLKVAHQTPAPAQTKQG